ncbi:MAG: hypothetical protein E6R05_03145 [Candidatus Moraniibacteriota bacterium]|nr:MAG: hypothetical protein E6R05_03145 [Candidatus Moranbacteria bacterium]
MSQPEKKEKVEKATLIHLEAKALETADAQAARYGGSSDVKAAQDLNPNKHNGSAGGDQLESIQIIAMDEAGKQEVVAERPKEVKQQPEITTEYLRERAKQPDIWAKKFVEDLDKAEKLPAPHKDGQIAKVLKDAEAVYRPKGHAEKPQDPLDKMAELAPKMEASAERLEQANEKTKVSGLDEGGVHQAVRTEAVARYLGRVEHSQPLENTPAGWLAAGQAIAKLPIEKQMEVIGAGLLAGVEQYQYDERERAIGQVLGTVQGVGQVLENLAAIAEFSADILCGNKARAEARGEMFGTAIGETLVSGVELFSLANKYLYDVGNRGEYGKPFKDLAELGVALNERWRQIPPREQERIKYKLITEMAADGLIGVGGAKALGKAKAFTEVMDAIAIEAKAAGRTTGKVIKGVGKQVVTDLKGMSQDVADVGKRVIRSVDDLIWDLIAPEMVLQGRGRMKFPREFGRTTDKPSTHVLMSQAEELSGGGSLADKGVDATGKALKFSQESGIEVGELRLGPDKVWEQAPFPRGHDVHVVLGENLPAGTKTIDRVVFKDGIAEGQKSIDLRADSYSDPKKFESKLRGYVHDLELYKGQKKFRMSFRMQQQEIEQKILHIGIKNGSISEEQKEVFEKVGRQIQQYNANLPIGKAPIKLKVTVVK